jgi:peroxiredoxin
MSLAGCVKERTKESVSRDFNELIRGANSWEYDITYKIKHLGSDDTLNFFTNCRLLRDESDTIFGGSFWIKNDSIDLYYDLNHIYSIDHNRNKIIRFFPHKGQDWAVRRNTFSGVLESYFLRTDRFSKLSSDSTISVRLQDSSVGGKDLTALEFRPQDNPPFEQQNKTFFFDEKTQLQWITYSVKFQNEWQYNEWLFSNSRYNSVSPETMSSELDSLKRDYIVEDYVARDPKELEPLATNSPAPQFSGLDRQSCDSISLKDYRGKFVLLDFWYKDCHYCVEAISALNKLRAEYTKDDLVILGLNPYDGTASKKDKLNDFVKKNKMSYPAIFVSKQVAKDYKVLAYPTFYIVDDKGQIIYSKVGYSAQGERGIDSLLSNRLR